MKKVLLTFCIVTALAMTACGPTNKEIEAKRVVDSTHLADSLCLVQAKSQHITDSIMKFKADSIKADSVAKVVKTVKATKKVLKKKK